MIYWILDETPEETPGFCGYSFGIVETKEQVPVDADAFESQDELDKAVEAIEEKIAGEQAEEPEDEDRTPPGQVGR